MIPITLGKTLTDVNVNFKLRDEGGSMLIGMPGCGKSCNLMNVLIKASKFKPFILFSYGPEYNNIMHSNTFSLEPDCVSAEKTVIIDDIRIKPSELDTQELWTYFGVPEGAADFLAKQAVKTEFHHDIPEVFFENVREAKVNVRNLQDKSSAIHEQSLISIIKSETRLMTYLSSKSVNWKELVKKRKNIIINLNLAKSDILTAQALVGFILRKIKPHVRKYIIAFEEADLLTYPDTFSGKEIIEYSKKKRKDKIFFFLVTQLQYDLPRDISDVTDQFIYGKFDMKGDTYLAKTVSSLKLSPEKDYREFVYFDRLSGFIVKFVPLEVSCYIEKRF